MAQESDWISADTKEAPASQFEKEIGDASKKYGVPSTWIKSVIDTESGGNPKAWRAEPKKGEGVGSRGLMQLMPETAQSLGFKDADLDKLYEPATNIDLGTKYLAQLRGKHGDDFSKVYSAYNSGSPTAYQSNPDVKANVERANKALADESEWISADAAKAPAAAPTGERLIERTPTEVMQDQAAAVRKGAITGFADFFNPKTWLENIKTGVEATGITGQDQDTQAARERLMGGFKHGIVDPLVLAGKGAIEFARPNTFPGIASQDQQWQEAAEAGGAQLGALGAGKVVPATLGAVSPYVKAGVKALVPENALPYVQAAPTLVKGLAKTGGKAAVGAVIDQTLGAIPVVGPTLSTVGKGVLSLSALKNLTKNIQEYGYEVALRKAGLNPEILEHEIPGDVAAAGTEAPIDVASTPNPRKRLGDVSGVKGRAATEAEMAPGRKAIAPAPDQSGVTGKVATEAERVPQKVIEGQRPTVPLVGPAPGQRMLPAPTEPATVAAQTAPATDVVPTESEQALPAAYRSVGPKTEAGTTATIGQQYTPPAGEQTVTPTARPMRSLAPGGKVSEAAIAQGEQEATPPKKPKIPAKPDKMPFKDWLSRMTAAQRTHVRKGLDAAEKEYQDLEKSIQESTEK